MTVYVLSRNAARGLQSPIGAYSTPELAGEAEAAAAAAAGDDAGITFTITAFEVDAPPG